MHEDFNKYGAVVGLTTVCVYGGAPMQSQEYALRRGVDVVVGTPGRVKDFLERGSLDCSKLRFRVLDEADEMLNMGALYCERAVLRLCARLTLSRRQALWMTWS